jgi:outer membrane immunogenic protein
LAEQGQHPLQRSEYRHRPNQFYSKRRPFEFYTGAIGHGGTGGLGGGGAGCNWQNQQWVYGLEGDIDGGRIAGNQTNSVTAATATVFGINPVTGLSGLLGNPTGTASESTQLNWLSTIRGRIGLIIRDRLLLFATGGLALGGVSSQGSVNVANSVVQVTWSGSHSAVNAGFAVGGGAEWALGDRWTAKAEYLWYDLGNVSHPLNCASVSPLLFASCSATPGPFATLGSAVSSIHGSIVRVGINYKFN